MYSDGRVTISGTDIRIEGSSSIKAAAPKIDMN